MLFLRIWPFSGKIILISPPDVGKETGQNLELCFPRYPPKTSISTCGFFAERKIDGHGSIDRIKTDYNKQRKQEMGGLTKLDGQRCHFKL